MFSLLCSLLLLLLNRLSQLLFSFLFVLIGEILQVLVQLGYQLLRQEVGLILWNFQTLERIRVVEQSGTCQTSQKKCFEFWINIISHFVQNNVVRPDV